MKLIVNVTDNWGIGKDNRLLAAISPDMKRFRALTTGKVVVYGRKTLLTFPGGKVLPKRRNIILSSDQTLVVENAEVAHSLEELFALLQDTPSEDICIIGGESIYRQLLPYCSEANVTRTHMDAEADRFFPNLDALDNWQVVHTEQEAEWEGYRYQFIDYVNLAPQAWRTEEGR